MITRRLTRLLLLTTALSMPSLAHSATYFQAGSNAEASTSPGGGSGAADAGAASQGQPEGAGRAAPDEPADVSLPGIAEIVVVGRRNLRSGRALRLSPSSRPTKSRGPAKATSPAR